VLNYVGGEEEILRIPIHLKEQGIDHLPNWEMQEIHLDRAVWAILGRDGLVPVIIQKVCLDLGL
jgi:hypothetical protein